MTRPRLKERIRRRVNRVSSSVPAAAAAVVVATEGVPVMHVRITLGNDTFDVEGEFALDKGFETVFRQWLNAKDEVPGKLEDLAERLETQSASLEAAVQAQQVPKG